MACYCMSNPCRCRMTALENNKYCGMHDMPVKEYQIRDKVFIIQLYEYGEGEPPFRELIIFAHDEKGAKYYYQKYKNDLPSHAAISIVER